MPSAFVSQSTSDQQQLPLTERGIEHTTMSNGLYIKCEPHACFHKIATVNGRLANMFGEVVNRREELKRLTLLALRDLYQAVNRCNTDKLLREVVTDTFGIWDPDTVQELTRLVIRYTERVSTSRPANTDTDADVVHSQKSDTPTKAEDKTTVKENVTAEGTVTPNVTLCEPDPSVEIKQIESASTDERIDDTTSLD